MNIDRAKLKSLAERIGRLMDERDAIAGDIRDIYTEAKSAEIVPKVLRKVIARKRAKDPAALLIEDDLHDTYLAALDGPTRKAVELAASGATAREIERETGIDQATVARSVSLKNKRETKSNPPHDIATGVIHEPDATLRSGSDSGENRNTDKESAGNLRKADSSDAAALGEAVETSVREEGLDAAPVALLPAHPSQPATASTITVDDELEFPPGFDRRVTALRTGGAP